jgi:hypothetical protein
VDRRRWATAYLVVSLVQGAVVLSLPGQVRPALPALLWIGAVFLLLRAQRRWMRVLGAVAEGWAFLQVLAGTISWDTQVGLLAFLQLGCLMAAVGAAWSSDRRLTERRPLPGAARPAPTSTSESWS